MAKEINFYRVDGITEEEMNKRFGQHLIRIEFEGKVYVMRLSEHDGKKLDFNEDTEELMKLTEYMTGRMGELKK